jgi:hypothetical protein
MNPTHADLNAAVRHPSMGGANEFRKGLAEIVNLTPDPEPTP